MTPLIFVLLLIAILLAVWIGFGPGREALRVIRQWPSLLAPALLLWFGATVLDELSSDSVRKALFRWVYKSVLFAPDTILLLKMLLHAVCAALLFWLLSGRGDPSRRPPFGRLLLGTVALLLGVWTALFLALVPILAMIAPVSTGHLRYLTPFAVLVVFLPINLAIAPLAALLPEHHGHPIKALFASLDLLARGRWRRWLPTVGLHFLVIGGFTWIWLDDYVKTIRNERTTDANGGAISVSYDNKWESFDAFNLSTHSRCVLNLTLDNEWIDEFYEAIEEKVPPHVSYATGLVTALLSTVFITAYALGAERRPSGGASPPIVAGPVPAPGLIG